MHCRYMVVPICFFFVVVFICLFFFFLGARWIVCLFKRLSVHANGN